MVRNKLFVCIAALTLTAIGQAQFNGGRIRDSNIVYVYDSLPNSPSGTGGAMNFTAEPTNEPDVLFQLQFAYRLDGDSRESLLNDGDIDGDGTPQVINETYGRTIGEVDWPDVDERGIFSVNQVIEAVPSGPRSGCMSFKITVTNLTNSNRTIDLFSYADVDLCGFANEATAINGNNTSIRITNPLCIGSNRFVDFCGIGADRYQVSTFPGIRAPLIDSAIDDLSNSGLPYNSSDFTGAMQWADRPLPANGSIQITVLLCHSQNCCGEEALTESFGSATSGLPATPRLATEKRPIIGVQGELELTNSRPTANAVLFFGAQRTDRQIANVRLLVDVIGDLPIPVDGTGIGNRRIQIPNDAALCGSAVVFQCMYVEPLVTGSLQVAHTEGIEWRIGGF